MSFWNPLHQIFIREGDISLWQRVLHTYEFFVGRYAYGGIASYDLSRANTTFPEQHEENNFDHLGSLDYLSFMLPYAISSLNYLTSAFEDYTARNPSALYALAVVLNTIVNFIDDSIFIAKSLVAGFLTLLVLPFVVILHIPFVITKAINQSAYRDFDEDGKGSDNDKSIKEEFLDLWHYKKRVRANGHVDETLNKKKPSWNPFYQVFETRKALNARTYRTDLKQKLVDTFHVFAGKESASKKKDGAFTPVKHIGLFDIAFLMLPYMLKVLYRRIYDFQSWSQKYSPYLLYPVASLFKLGLSLLYYPVEVVARLAFAGLATLFVSPIVCIVHGIAQLSKGKALKSVVHKIDYVEEKNSTRDIEGNLGLYLKVNWKITLEDLKVKSSTLFSIANDDNAGEGTTSQKRAVVFAVKNKKIAKKEITLEFDLDEKNDRRSLAALLELNVGGITTLFAQRKSEDADRTTQADQLFALCAN